MFSTSNFLAVLPLCFALWLSSLGAAGQTVPDSSRVTYSEEVISDSLPINQNGSLYSKYSQLVRLQIEERQLWKLGLNNFTINTGSQGLDYLRTGVHLIYERKLGTAWSVLGEVSPDFVRYRAAGTNQLRNGLAARAQLAGRYYYNLNQRIRKGKSASNFSANYLSLALGSGLGRPAQETPFFGYNYGGPVARLDAAVLYGLQRRLGRYGFVDFNFGFPFHLTHPDLSQPDPYANTTNINIMLLLRIGLALGR